MRTYDVRSETFGCRYVAPLPTDAGLQQRYPNSPYKCSQRLYARAERAYVAGRPTMRLPRGCLDQDVFTEAPYRPLPDRDGKTIVLWRGRTRLVAIDPGPPATWRSAKKAPSPPPPPAPATKRSGGIRKKRTVTRDYWTRGPEKQRVHVTEVEEEEEGS